MYLTQRLMCTFGFNQCPHRLPLFHGVSPLTYLRPVLTALRPLTSCFYQGFYFFMFVFCQCTTVIFFLIINVCGFKIIQLGKWCKSLVNLYSNWRDKFCPRQMSDVCWHSFGKSFPICQYDSVLILLPEIFLNTAFPFGVSTERLWSIFE